MYTNIINHIIELQHTFNENTHSYDSHFDDYSILKKLTDQNELIFIKTVFYGINRYQPMLDSLNKGLSEIVYVKKDLCLINSIISYLIIFKIDNLPIQELKEIIESQDKYNMYTLLKSLLNQEFLINHVRSKWEVDYDLSYIDQFVIEQMEKRKQKCKNINLVKKIFENLEEKIENKQETLVETINSSPSQKQKKITIPKEFNLHKPKPRNIPHPIIIEQQVKANSVNQEILGYKLASLTQKNNERLQEIKQKTLQKHQKEKQFNFQIVQRESDLQQLIQKSDEEFNRLHDFNKKFSQPMPDFSKMDGEVKQNINQILREQQILMQQEKQKIDREKYLEINLRDSSEFENWKKKQFEQDNFKRLEQTYKCISLIKVKIQMELQREIAIKAQEDLKEKNQKNAENMKNQKNQLKQKFQKELNLSLQNKKKIIEQIQSEDHLAQDEVQKHIKKNQIQRIELQKELSIIQQLKKDEDEKELLKKQKLIAEIRALQKQPKQILNNFDPQKNMGYGFLEEMSLFELKKRLSEIKIEQEQLIKTRHHSLEQQKVQKLNTLNQKLQQIQELKQDKIFQKEQQKEQIQLEKIQEQEKIHNLKQKQLLELYDKITDKKSQKYQEELLWKKKQKDIKLFQQYQNSDFNAMEAKMNENLIIGQQREIKNRIEQEIFSQFQIDKAKVFNMKEIQNNKILMKMEKLNKQNLTEKHLQEQIKINDQNNLFDELEAIRKFKQTKQHEVDLIKFKNESNRYIEKINKISLQNSKKKLLQKSQQQIKNSQH